MSLADLTPALLRAIEAELRSAVGPEAAREAWRRNGSGQPPAGGDYLTEYYAMLAYHLGWTDTGRTGKRIRPLLCLLCCLGVSGRWEPALPVAAAIELIHNFSLIHDDIQDHGEVRHGRLTVWVRWGMPQAINAGDGMFALAHLAPHALLTRGASAELALAVLGELDLTCLALTQGQHLDMAFEGRSAVSVAEYLTMIEKKTAMLLAAATHLGARAGAGEAHNPALPAYRRFGLNLGLAFQLQDDLLGIWGDPAVTGKSAASDLRARKKSLPVVFGMQQSAHFAADYTRPPEAGEGVDGLARELEVLGARDFVAEHVRATTALARAALEEAQPAEPAASALRELTDQLLQRRQ